MPKTQFTQLVFYEIAHIIFVKKLNWLMVAVKCEATVLLQLGAYIKYIGIFPQFLTSFPPCVGKFYKEVLAIFC